MLCTNRLGRTWAESWPCVHCNGCMPVGLDHRPPNTPLDHLLQQNRSQHQICSWTLSRKCPKDFAHRRIPAFHIVYMHHSTEGHVQDKDMQEAQSGRHDIVLHMFFFVCDVNCCNFPMNPRRLRPRLSMSVCKMCKGASSGHYLYFLLAFRSKECIANDVWRPKRQADVFQELGMEHVLPTAVGQRP